MEGNAEAKEVLCIPAVHMGSILGLDTCVVAYTTDIRRSMEPGVRRIFSVPEAFTLRTPIKSALRSATLWRRLRRIKP